MKYDVFLQAKVGGDSCACRTKKRRYPNGQRRFALVLRECFLGNYSTKMKSDMAFALMEKSRASSVDDLLSVDLNEKVLGSVFTR